MNVISLSTYSSPKLATLCLCIEMVHGQIKTRVELITFCAQSCFGGEPPVAQRSIERILPCPLGSRPPRTFRGPLNTRETLGAHRTTFFSHLDLRRTSALAGFQFKAHHRREASELHSVGIGLSIPASCGAETRSGRTRSCNTLDESPCRRASKRVVPSAEPGKRTMKRSRSTRRTHL